MLGVERIVVCGHSGCGAMTALAERRIWPPTRRWRGRCRPEPSPSKAGSSTSAPAPAR
ncbi:carbonic anhydrase [Nocardia sp. BSTN01]|uniref:carbonic anhydrase n=1 Tax=Nocardia sp. BSTN01 TaxID=2783665 RepID=UPI00272E0E39|nr:carbonic anhydrase [Nocardia sp. BSTN01]